MLFESTISWYSGSASTGPTTTIILHIHTLKRLKYVGCMGFAAGDTTTQSKSTQQIGLLSKFVRLLEYTVSLSDSNLSYSTAKVQSVTRTHLSHVRCGSPVTNVFSAKAKPLVSCMVTCTKHPDKVYTHHGDDNKAHTAYVHTTFCSWVVRVRIDQFNHSF